MVRDQSHRKIRGQALVAVVVALLAASVHAADPATVAPQPMQASPRNDTPAAPSVDNKLDAQITLALKQSRGEPPFDKPTTIQPDIPIRDGPRVLVDLSASVSDDLLKHVETIGGRLAPSPDSAKVVRAMIPLGELEALARRTDITYIAPARLYRISRLDHDPKSPAGTSATKP